MLNNKLCLTSVVEFLRRGHVDRGTEGGKVVVVVDSSKRKVITDMAHINCRCRQRASEVMSALSRLKQCLSTFINKLLNKLSQFLLCTKWIDKGLFDCHGLHHSKVATGQREHLPGGSVSPFGNNPARQMSS
jgi:hypothetical protein